METAMDDAKGVTPNIGAAYEITVFDKDGKVRQVINEDAKCYVMNFSRMIRHWFLCSGGSQNTSIYANFKNLSGSIVSSAGVAYPTVGSFKLDGLAGILTKGIIVGTDGTAVTADDYKIGSLINNGTDAGRLSYDANVIAAFTESGSTMTMPVSRLVSNGTSNPVVFSEIALYALGQITIMVLRDVISPSVTLGVGESALIVYKLIING
jgi:hypothetical protein